MTAALQIVTGKRKLEFLIQAASRYAATSIKCDINTIEHKFALYKLHTSMLLSVGFFQTYYDLLMVSLYHT